MNNKAFNKSLKDNRYPIIPCAWFLFATLLLFILSNTVSEYFYYLSFPLLFLTIYLCYMCYNQIKSSYEENANKEDFFDDGKNTTYYLGNNKKSVVYIKNGVRDGHFTSFFENGNMSCECDYVLGKKNGYCSYYYKNSKIKSEGNYKDDERDGLWKNYYENGKIKIIHNYVKCVQNGLTTSYFNSGEILRKSNFINGEYDTVKEYFLNGKIKFTIENNIYSFYNQNGVLKCEANFKGAFNSSNFKGVWRNYKANGRIDYELNFDDKLSNHKENKVVKTIFTNAGEIYSNYLVEYKKVFCCEVNFINSHYKDRMDRTHYTYHYPRLMGPPGISNPSPKKIELKPINSLNDIISFE